LKKESLSSALKRRSNIFQAESDLKRRTFETSSSFPLKAYYEKSRSAGGRVPPPGQYPYTRGIHPEMYRTRLWTMRQFAGFGTARDTNQRFKLLLQKGQTGLSTAFDLPTLMGYDSDHPKARGEVGKCGVAIDSLKDMKELFAGIPLDKITVSMTVNGPAVFLYCFYLGAAKAQKVPLKLLKGTLQNDILKEYIAQRCWIFPPRPSLRLITDLFKFSLKNTPSYNTISISGYHIREAGATAAQELAFTLADGFTYVEEGIKAGLSVDEFAPRLSFFFDIHMDFFEEIAKLRAARRIWARHMKERYKARDPRSLKLRFHAQTAGCSLTEQQPENNIVRTAYEAMAAVLGGCQSLHTNSLDETIALPSELAAHIALRTQQVLGYETNVDAVADPLGGSYYVEQLTDRIEAEAEDYFRKIRKLGGVVECIASGFYQKELSESALNFQRELERKERVLVGVNAFTEEKEMFEPPILKIGEEVERTQKRKLGKLRKERSHSVWSRSIRELKTCARGKQNLIPKVLAAVEAYATEGEIADALKEEFGIYEPPSIF